jgi:hypothetical protein
VYPGISVSQSYLYYTCNSNLQSGSYYSARELNIHNRIIYHHSPFWGIGFHNISFLTWEAGQDRQILQLSGIIAQFSHPLLEFQNFRACIETGFLAGNYIVLNEPYSRTTRQPAEYIPAGFSFQRFFKQGIFIDGGAGVLVLLKKKDSRAATEDVFLRLGFGYNFRLKKDNSRKHGNVRSL